MKTAENDGDVDAFLAAVENETRREDSLTILAMMQRVTGLAPKMWGDSIVGFDRYHYKYHSEYLWPHTVKKLHHVRYIQVAPASDHTMFYRYHRA
mgnify:CR=1 FL=1